MFNGTNLVTVEEEEEEGEEEEEDKEKEKEKQNVEDLGWGASRAVVQH